MEDQQIKKILMRKNDAFKQLYLRHQQHEEELKKITAKTHRTDNERLEEKRLKKEKLRLKDSMQKYIVEYKNKMENYYS